MRVRTWTCAGGEVRHELFGGDPDCRLSLFSKAPKSCQTASILLRSFADKVVGCAEGVHFMLFFPCGCLYGDGMD